jgi:hypothetical protein
MADFDFDLIEEVEDVSDEEINILIFDHDTGEYGWHCFFKDVLEYHGRFDLMDSA